MHPIEIPGRLRDQAVINFTTISPTTTALVVVDMQVVFTEPGQPLASPYSSEIIPAINRVAAAVRENGGKVVFTRHTITREGPRAIKEWDWNTPACQSVVPLLGPGRREHGLNPQMDVQPGDVVIDKYRYSALTFNSSDLNEILQAESIDTVIIAGVVSNCCCESTARDASMLGYKTFFLADAAAAFSDEEHVGTLTTIAAIFGSVTTAEEMVNLLKGRKIEASTVFSDSL